jgi:CDP-2,3-bis-(O-geranylgeranyl)-sn-glycerol synthase
MLKNLLQILLMLLATNGAPILVARLLRSRWDLAMDMGKKLSDGQPLFGSSKTWRGFFAALGTASLLSVVLGHGIWFGLMFGVLVMIGDLISSFVKRRRGLKPSDQSMGWDQLPEALIPSLYAVLTLGYSWWLAIPLTLGFMLIGVLVSKPLFHIKIRKRPY